MKILTRILIIGGVILAIGAVDNLYYTTLVVAIIAVGVYPLRRELP